MNNNKIVHNLDEKQNPPEIIILGGVEMDISFIPCGVAIPLTRAYEEWREHFNTHGKDVIKNDNNIAQENTILLARTVSIFTKYIDEKISEEYLLKNLPVEKLGFIFRKIMNAITGNVTNNTDQEDDSQESKKKEISNGNVQ